MRYVIAIFAVVLVASCSVKKRNYRSGYYIDWAFKKKVSSPARTETPSESKESSSERVVVAAKQKEISEEFFTAKIKNTLLIDTCGDVITFKSGEQVTAKVIEITEEKIKYKRCDNLDGPSFVVSKANVTSIRYANGVEEKIVAPVQQTPQTTQPNNQNQLPYFMPQKRIHPKAISALIVFLVLPFLGVIISMILAGIAMKEIKAEPNKYRGLGLANTIFIIDCIIMGLLLLLIVLTA